MTIMQTIWFILIAILLVGYTLLDGYDLGVGFWTAFLRNEKDRRTALASIAPFWNANEVWIITGAGATFAAFPSVYAAAFSGLYPLLFALLFALILRGISLEFGSQERERRHAAWATVFAVSSMAGALLLGMILGNLLRGLPVDARGDVRFDPTGMFSAFALLVGLLNVALLATHGALYLRLRTNGPLQRRAGDWAQNAWGIAIVLLVITATTAVWAAPHLFRRYQEMPTLILVPVLGIFSLLLIGHLNRRQRSAHAFAASIAGITLLLASAGIGLFPTMIPTLLEGGRSLTAANAASSSLTLRTMLVFTLIGLPVVLGYTVWLHRVFRGKADDDLHY